MIDVSDIMRSFDRGVTDAKIAGKHNLSMAEVKEMREELKKARRQDLHNRVVGMFLMGFTVAELPKYFGLTESEIRDILTIPATS